VPQEQLDKEMLVVLEKTLAHIEVAAVVELAVLVET
jgi:hypothetical protein